MRKDGTRQTLPSKFDNVRGLAGDRLIFRTAGGGGWGDPLERDPMRTRNDVARRLMTETKAREEYGVVLTGPRLELDRRATDDLRDGMRRNRKTPKLFDFGERRAQRFRGPRGCGRLAGRDRQRCRNFVTGTPSNGAQARWLS